MLQNLTLCFCRCLQITQEISDSTRIFRLLGSDRWETHTPACTHTNAHTHTNTHTHTLTCTQVHTHTVLTPCLMSSHWRRADGRDPDTEEKGVTHRRYTFCSPPSNELKLRLSLSGLLIFFVPDCNSLKSVFLWVNTAQITYFFYVWHLTRLCDCLVNLNADSPPSWNKWRLPQTADPGDGCLFNYGRLKLPKSEHKN